MATKKIKPEQLGEAINEILTEYADEVVENSKEAVDATAKMAVQVAQAYASRIGRGRYARSIKSTKTETTMYGTTVTIHSTQYRVAHLLEHGHVLKIRGKVRGTTRAFPHFAPAEAMAESALEQKIKQAIQRS
ncbi:MAG: HK97 gp10 family phage protein [Clostridiales bacterium]|nr:HK97 gp10 family phage protein [Clostridiales bacterium]MBQ1571433.1 HK97 gp10 family phage protein [Clostridiales bacterium]